MTWGAESGRSAPLPANWTQLRRHVISRARGECEWTGPDPDQPTEPPCGLNGTDVDHIHDPMDHDPANLRLLCADHHRARTSQQGNEARWQHRRERPRERHPGVLPP